MAWQYSSSTPAAVAARVHRRCLTPACARQWVADHLGGETMFVRGPLRPAPIDRPQLESSRLSQATSSAGGVRPLRPAAARPPPGRPHRGARDTLSQVREELDQRLSEVRQAVGTGDRDLGDDRADLATDNAGGCD